MLWPSSSPSCNQAMSRRQTSGAGDKEERRVHGILSRASRRKSEAGVAELIHQRKLLDKLTSRDDKEPVSSSSESELDDDMCEEEMNALDSAVAEGLAAIFEPQVASAQVVPVSRQAKNLVAFNCQEETSPYLRNSAIVAGALSAQKGMKGAAKDAVALAEISSLYQAPCRPLIPSGSKTQKRVTSGKDWFNLAATEMTEELKQDLRAVRMRGALDPKRFYKAFDRPSKFVQVGTVIEGRDEFFTSRLTKKERRTNLVEELMADVKARQYTKRKFNDIQKEKKNKRHFGPKKRTKLQSKAGKKVKTSEN
jgi:hypothetical protein